MSAFEDFVNLELPRRSALLTVEIVGYDGDPNNPSAPPALAGAPKGTWYLRETPSDTFYRKDSTGDWVESGGGGGGGALDILYSLTPLAATVDYDDVNAVDPPVDTIFSSQQEIDDYLAAQGAVAFKHLQKLWDALPVFIFHSIDVALTGTVHRPASDAGDNAFDFSGKYFLRDGAFVVEGAPPSEWTDVVAAQTIIDHQALGSGVANWDPWVQVSGTPFAGLDLKGLFVVLDTGQSSIIHDHTDDTLYLMDELTPVPINSTTTVRVCRPATVFQNSTDGINRKSSSACVYLSCDAGVLAPTWFKNVWFQSFGSTWAVWASRTNATVRMLSCLFDNAEEVDTFSKTPQRSLQVTGSEITWLESVSFRSRVGLSDRNPIFFNTNNGANFVNCYFRGHRYNLYCEDSGSLSFFSSVLEDVGWALVSERRTFIVLIGSSEFYPINETYYAGKRNTFRAISHTGNAIVVSNNPSPFIFNGRYHGCWFGGFQSAVLLVDGSDCSLKDSGASGRPGWLNDVAANLDVGIEIVGGGHTIEIGAATEISGTVGDVRLEGIVGPYADLPPASSPLVTTKLNIVSKEV